MAGNDETQYLYQKNLQNETKRNLAVSQSVHKRDIKQY